MIEEPKPAGELERAAPGDLAEVAQRPDDFYVTLQELSLGLVARQLELLSIEFTSTDGLLTVTRPERYTLTASEGVGDVLHLRVRLASAFSARMVAALEARCNWWNDARGFLSASTRVALVPISADEQEARALVHLDLDLPCRVGIAPVQLQALVTDVLRNVDRFMAEARLEQLGLDGAWG